MKRYLFSFFWGRGESFFVALLGFEIQVLRRIQIWLRCLPVFVALQMQ